MLRFTKPKLSRVVWAVHLDEGPIERWKLKPQVCACSQGKDERDGAEPWRRRAGFRRGAGNVTQWSETSGKKRSDIVQGTERKNSLATFTGTSFPERYREKADGRELRGEEQVRE